MMKPSRILIVAFLIGYYSLAVKAQVINSELYQFNYLSLNPAFAGRGGQSISFLAKTIKYPSSYFAEAFLMYETKFDNIHSGFGVTASSVVLGISSETSLNLNYSYSIEINKSSRIKLGSRISNNRMHIDFSRYQNVDPNDPILIPDSEESISNFAFSPGILAEFGNFYASISAENLISTGNYEIGSSRIEDYDLYNIALGYSYKLKNWGELRHSVFVPLLDGDLPRVDLNNIFLIKKVFIAGITLEFLDKDIVPKVNVGFRVKDFMEITTILYSKRRDNYNNSNFSGSIFVRFYLPD